MLLADRHQVSGRTPLPVQDVTSSTKILAVTGESVSFSDGAAGTTQRLKLNYDGVMSLYQERMALDGDTSISWTTGTVLVTEVPWKFKNTNGKDNETDRLASLSNGEYMIDYENGYILGKNAISTSSTTDTIAYKVRTIFSTIQGNITVTGSTVPSSTNADAFTVDQSATLGNSSVSKASAGNVFKLAGRIDELAPSDDYYLQLINASSLPADGSVTFLMAPLKIVHTTNSDTFFDIDLTPAGIPASTGIVWCLSTTEFTKTVADPFASVTILYK